VSGGLHFVGVAGAFVFLLKEGLEDQGGSDLVDYFFVLLAGAVGLVEDFVGFAGGEALVPEVNGEARELGQIGGPFFGLAGAGAFFAGEMDGVADDDGGDGVAAGEAGDGAEVVAAVAMGFEGEDGLGGDAEFVGDGYSDAPGANVEGEVAGWGTGMQLLAPSFQLNTRNGRGRCAGLAAEATQCGAGGSGFAQEFIFCPAGVGQCSESRTVGDVSPGEGAAEAWDRYNQYREKMRIPEGVSGSPRN
jgi:hypothetical protein